jgi:hypothetical protein
VFNLDKDKSSFYTWKEKWDAYLTAHGFNQIQDEERKKRIQAEFTTAMANQTLRWLSNQGFNDEYNDAEFLINAIENYIKGNTNPLVQNVELLMLKKTPEESGEHFLKRLQKKPSSELDKIKNRPIISLWCVSLLDMIQQRPKRS